MTLSIDILKRQLIQVEEKLKVLDNYTYAPLNDFEKMFIHNIRPYLAEIDINDIKESLVKKAHNLKKSIEVLSNVKDNAQDAEIIP